MEELGIGRPSTYAATLKTLDDREYVKIDKRKLIPRGQGPAGDQLSSRASSRNMSNMTFTADLEEKLDEISDGKLD